MESSNTRCFVSCTLYNILNFSRGWSVLSLTCCLLLWKIPKTNTLKELRFILPDCCTVSIQDQRAAFCLALSHKIVAEGCWFLGVGGGRGFLCQATVCFSIISSGQQVIIMPLTLKVSHAQWLSLLGNRTQSYAQKCALLFQVSVAMKLTRNRYHVPW